MTKFDEIYQEQLRRIMNEGIEEKNERTGHKTKAIPGLTFSIDIEKDGFPLLTLRKTPIKLFIAEQCWFLSAGRKPEDFLGDFTKIWNGFTNPGDVVTVAYGYRWRKHFGRDQIALLIDMLEKDPSSRHGVIVTWDQASDGLGGAMKKNVPCPYTFTVNIIGGKLNLHNVVRSNDMLLGAPADIAGFAFLQCLLAQRLGVKPGIYTHTVSNAHIYDTHYVHAEELISRKNDHPKIILNLPEHSFERAERKEKEFVEEVANSFLSQYNPMEAIKGIELIL